MDVPILLQPPVTLPGIGDDRCPRLDVIQHEGVKRFCGGIRHGRHSTAPKSLWFHDFDCDTRQDLLPFGTASRKSRFFASDIGFVHFHLSAKALSIGANQHRPQAMKDRPHCLIGADLQGPLQTQRRDPVFAGSKMPTDRKPNRKGSTGPVKDGACHHWCAATASSTHEPAVPKPPSSRMTTGRADEAARPSQPFQVVQAVCISREPSLKLPKRLRVVGAGMGTFHCPNLRPTPVKWIPQTKVFTLTLALGKIGDALWTRVGREPSGTPFNSIVQLEHENGIPRNPFINAGAIVLCDVLLAGRKPRETIGEILEFVRFLADDETIAIDPAVAAAEKATGYRNVALANFMMSCGSLAH